MPTLLLCTLVFFPATVGAGEPLQKKVLILGIDGCRPDAIPAALEAFNLHALIKEGAFSDRTDVLGPRKTGADTITGPGWAAVLTGVWADRHGVRDNFFRDTNFKEYPTFFERLKEARPDAITAALVTWKPFREHYFPGRLGCQLLLDGDKVGYEEGDRQVTLAAEKLFEKKNLDAVFLYFGTVDITGHGYHFHPKSPKYTKSLEVVDAQIGRVLKALRNRPTFAKEDWLVMVCTDHGGRMREHSQGEKTAEIRTGFLILHGPSVKKGKIDGMIYNVDVAVTALTHLEVPIRAEWKLDGRAVGLK